MFDSTVLFTGNKSAVSNDWAPIIPEAFHYVTDEVTAETIQSVANTQKQYNVVKRENHIGGELHTRSNMAMVMDDISGYRSQLNKLSAVFNNSRHYSIFILLCGQQYTNVTPEVRKSMNAIITMGTDPVSERDRLYDEFFSFVPSKKLFIEIFNIVTATPFMALVGDRNVYGNNWRNRLFYYRAKPYPSSFKLGSHSFWESHYMRYNPKHNVELLRWA
ncbi:hypothetical protein SARC_03977 [Sphaeroforma arctica JP610]|uniref:Uncharacterized protein n=1 Tax=Sphaeroforma arctica JP610 TaxID=667725 RepID=A0A0L0G4S2_9EUKA|nr:hypothetical protein SARC_03977 [Sphaeroforma arctica JP610]KNC83801.1 hypothetical protein SARC_03977 [Sphaeroforma arctica JP610]|eukprot:XP_014157703.1 hypothetical protein SARC_03977 [Sphaeroforma arctica JP610]